MKPPQFKIGDRVTVIGNDGIPVDGNAGSEFLFFATVVEPCDEAGNLAVEDDNGDTYNVNADKLRLVPNSGMITQITGTCAWEGCDKPATHIAAGAGLGWGAIKGHEKPACYCKSHAESVQAEGISEYHIKCPNCRCLFQC